MSTPEQTPEHIPYEITGQEKTEKLRPDGRFEEVWRISFQAPNGTHSWVEVPVSQYTPANVDAIIENELDTIMGVHVLGPQPHPENKA